LGHYRSDGERLLLRDYLAGLRIQENHWHKRKLAMSEEQSDAQDFVRVPAFQRVLDNPFILLFIGVVVPTVFYIIWGIMEIVTIPIAP
jgi:hypothetical protein